MSISRALKKLSLSDEPLDKYTHSDNLISISHNITRKEKRTMMKKLIAFVISISLIAGLSAFTMAAPAKKKVKKPAKRIVKTVKKPVKKPIKKFKGSVKKPVKKPIKKPVKKPAKKIVKPVKKPMLTPWVPPAPQPVAPVIIPKAAAPSGGIGLSLGAKIGLSGGATGMIVDLDYSINSILAGTKIRVGGDYLSGTNPVGNNSYKMSNLRLGLVYGLDMLKSADMPINWYVTGSLLYPWKVNAGRTGQWGIEAAVGGNYAVPDFGSIYGEVGYAGIKYTSTQPAIKGISASIGYSHAF
jgi:hypothetical protein